MASPCLLIAWAGCEKAGLIATYQGPAKLAGPKANLILAVLRALLIQGRTDDWFCRVVRSFEEGTIV